MPSEGSVNSHHHQCRDNEIDASSKDGIIEGLCERPALPGNFHDVYDAAKVADEEEGRYVPTKDGNWLSDGEAEATGHIQEEREVGDQSSTEGKTIHGEEPVHCISETKLERRPSLSGLAAGWLDNVAYHLGSLTSSP